MRELHEFAEVKTAWLNQPEPEFPVDMERRQRWRTWELSLTTRSEIISSIGAALFFAGIVVWRFPSERDRLAQLGCAAVLVWVGVTIFWFRNTIHTARPDALAKTGLEHYRLELLRRRNHLRSAWIWHGPLLLAFLLAAATLSRRIVPAKLWNALPLFLLLVAWVVMGIKRRLREAAELQREIDEISAA